MKKITLFLFLLLLATPLYGEGPEEGLNRFRVHVVQKGENLHIIAARYYNNARLWRLIYNVNHGSIKDPNLIHPGDRLLIPELED